MKGSGVLEAEYKELLQKRKSGEIGVKEYYAGLLKLLTSLAEDLKEEDIDENEIKKQIPLLTVFISEQIAKMKEREH